MIERIFISFMLLLGVAIFSVILGEFENILSQLNAISAENEDYNNLGKFFGLLKYMNYGRPLRENLKA